MQSSAVDSGWRGLVRLTIMLRLREHKQLKVGVLSSVFIGSCGWRVTLGIYRGIKHRVDTYLEGALSPDEVESKQRQVFRSRMSRRYGCSAVSTRAKQAHAIAALHHHINNHYPTRPVLNS